MKNNRFFYPAILVSLVSVLFIYGCVSVEDSPSPRFYVLRPAARDRISQKFNVSANAVIGFGPVKIPEYLNRPQIVTQNKDKTLNFAQFDRWGESLDLSLERIMSENLIALLAGADIEMFPWNLAVPVQYQVIMNVVQLESKLDKDLFLVVQWSVINAHNKEIVVNRRSEISKPIEQRTYSGMVEALSVACAELSREMAEALVKLENRV